MRLRRDRRAAVVMALALIGILVSPATPGRSAVTADAGDARQTLYRYAHDTWASFVAMPST